MEENGQSTSGTTPIIPHNEDSTQPTMVTDVPSNDNAGNKNSKIFKIALIALLILAIPVGMILVKNTTDSRSHAAEFNDLTPTPILPTMTPPPVRTTPGIKTTIIPITPTSPPWPTPTLTPQPSRFLTPTPTPRSGLVSPHPSP